MEQILNMWSTIIDTAIDSAPPLWEDLLPYWALILGIGSLCAVIAIPFSLFKGR